jgi:protein-S-isoprenylcysteine O-methyltransferase Ste14
MHIRSAVLGSAIFFIVVPCTVAGLIPWLLARRYDEAPPRDPVLAAACFVAIVCAVSVLLYSFAHFALKGRGTPAPIAPTENLVVSGPYRFVRNPMYVAVLSIIFAQALLFSAVPVLIYGLLVCVAMVVFTRFYEEPTLGRRHGSAYDRYRAAVPGWWPRLTPRNGQ